MAKRCLLKLVEDKLSRSHTIELLHNVETDIGRTDFDINDDRVSDTQFKCKANTKAEEVLVIPVGIYESGCNGLKLANNHKYVLKNGDYLELLVGHYQIEVAISAESTTSVETFTCQVRDGRKSNSGAWQSIDHNQLLIFTGKDFDSSRSKVASFDLDGTIITTKSGRRFPANSEDWKFKFWNIKTSIKSLHMDHKIIIFTNQLQLSGSSMSKVQDFQNKIEAISQECDNCMQVFVSTARSKYRKPVVGMWDAMRFISKNAPIDLANSFYVGDAAGRIKNWAPGQSADHSCSDRMFALNLNITFLTPEEYFLKSDTTLHAAKYNLPSFNPIAYGQQPNDQSLPIIESTADRLHCIILVGYPGSGKTHYARTYLVPKGYVWVNRDSLGSWQKCIDLTLQSLRDNKNVVIDNTNPDCETRQRYTKICKGLSKVKCSCHIMSTTESHAKHNNRYRTLTKGSKNEIKDPVYNIYRSKYQEPCMDEGFDEIVRVPFVLKLDQVDTNIRYYRMFLGDD